MQPVQQTSLRSRTVLVLLSALAIAFSVLLVTPSSADEECLADAERDVLDRVTGSTGVNNPRADLLSMCVRHLSSPPPGAQVLTLSARLGAASDIATDGAWQPGRSALVFELRINPAPGDGGEVERDYDVIVGRAGAVPAFTVREVATGEATCTQAIPAEGLPTEGNPLLTIGFDPAACTPVEDGVIDTVAAGAYLFFTEPGGNSLIDEVPPNAQGYGSRLDGLAHEARGYPGVLRPAGPDRIATAIAISQRSYADDSPSRPDVAVLATSGSFPDALSAAPLAVRYNGPLLLTLTSRLHESVEQELLRILPEGSTVYLVGGEAALSGSIDDELAELGYLPRRLAGGEGTGRHETALAVAREIHPNPARVVLADGAGFHMPLLGATYAASTNNLRFYDESNLPGGNGVLLLTGGPPSYQAALMDYLGPDRPGREYVVVGTQAQAFAEANALPVADDNRLVVADDNPFSTADLVARRFDGDNGIDPPAEEPAPDAEPTPEGGFAQDDAEGDPQPTSPPSEPPASPAPVRDIATPSFVVVVTATNFADAIPAATLAGFHESPLLFAWRDTITQDTRELLASSLFDGLQTGFVVGGSVALGDQVAEQVSACVRDEDFAAASCESG